MTHDVLAGQWNKHGKRQSDLQGGAFDSGRMATRVSPYIRFWAKGIWFVSFFSRKRSNAKLKQQKEMKRKNKIHFARNWATEWISIEFYGGSGSTGVDRRGNWLENEVDGLKWQVKRELKSGGSGIISGSHLSVNRSSRSVSFEQVLSRGGAIVSFLSQRTASDRFQTTTARWWWWGRGRCKWAMASLTSQSASRREVINFYFFLFYLN